MQRATGSKRRKHGDLRDTWSCLAKRQVSRWFDGKFGIFSYYVVEYLSLVSLSIVAMPMSR